MWASGKFNFNNQYVIIALWKIIQPHNHYFVFVNYGFFFQKKVGSLQFWFFKNKLQLTNLTITKGIILENLLLIEKLK